jgi:hypothetical protein
LRLLLRERMGNVKVSSLQGNRLTIQNKPETVTNSLNASLTAKTV